MTVEIAEEEQGDVMILRIDGRLDAASSPLVEQKITTHIESGKKKLVMNFERVEYISSAGLRLLLSVGKKLVADGGKMVVCSVADDVMEVVQMAGFDRVLEIHNTEKEATSALT